MNEPWTPGPWKLSAALLVAEGDVFVADLVSAAPVDRRLIAAAPEMAELLADLLRLDGLVGKEYGADSWWDEAFAKVAPLLSRIRGEVSVT